MYGDYLSHYGVIGMHWGKRKESSNSSSKPKSSGDPEWDHVKGLYKKTGKNGLSRVVNNIKGSSKEVKTYKKAYDKYTDKKDREYDQKMKEAPKKKRSVKDMSDEELTRLNKRLQLEKTYKELSKADVSNGRKVVTSILSNAGKQAATNFAAKQMTSGLEKIFKTK